MADGASALELDRQGGTQYSHNGAAALSMGRILSISAGSSNAEAILKVCKGYDPPEEPPDPNGPWAALLRAVRAVWEAGSISFEAEALIFRAAESDEVLADLLEDALPLPSPIQRKAAELRTGPAVDADSAAPALFQRVTASEMRVLESLRCEDVSGVSIHRDGQGLCRIELHVDEDPDQQIDLNELVRREEYADIRIVVHRGQIRRIERTIKKSLR